MSQQIICDYCKNPILDTDPRSAIQVNRVGASVQYDLHETQQAGEPDACLNIVLAAAQAVVKSGS